MPVLRGENTVADGLLSIHVRADNADTDRGIGTLHKFTYP